MKDASEKVLEELSSHGYRITNARRQVCEVLAADGSPLTIQELVEKVDIDEASVYRTIKILQKERLVEEVSIEGGKTHFELAAHHHHHAVCRDCGLIAHLPCSPEPQVPKKVSGFCSLDSHELTFYGLCVKCA